MDLLRALFWSFGLVVFLLGIQGTLYFPLTMRTLCNAILIPPRAFWREFDIPRSVKKELFFRSPESRKWLRDMFSDVRMLAYDTGLMENRSARLMWRICRINGKPSRSRCQRRRHTT